MNGNLPPDPILRNRICGSIVEQARRPAHTHLTALVVGDVSDGDDLRASLDVHPRGSQSTIVTLATDDDSVPVRRHRHGPGLLRGAYSARAHELRNFLAPYAGIAPLHPRGSHICVVILTTDDGCVPVRGHGNRPTLPRSQPIGADEFRALLAPHARIARVHPRGSHDATVTQATHDGCVPVRGHGNRKPLARKVDTRADDLP